MTKPAIRVLSLGAGVQSTVLALMACDGTLPKPDAAVFADTGWEPRRVYDHLDRLEAKLTAAGIPLYRVSSGNLRTDALDPEHRYCSVPYFVLNPPRQIPLFAPCPARCDWWDYLQTADELDDNARPADCATCGNKGGIRTGERPATRSEREGMGRRQCTSEYKLKPIKAKVRELLGYPHPTPVPRGVFAEQWIGFSTDEIHRVRDTLDVQYSRPRHPLLELGMSRKDCVRWLTARGWSSVAKSACIGCPFHGNAQWRDLRDNYPEEWADAVAFDEAIRKGGARGLPLNGEAFLHRSRVPLAVAPINRVTRAEWADRQVDLLDVLADIDAGVDELGDPDGCSPYGCRSGEPSVSSQEETKEGETDG